jgi:F420-dependent oxidoreductase-like protein
MKIGLQVPSFTFPPGTAGIGATLAQIARTADEYGFASLWVMDHFFQISPGLGAVDSPMLESYSALNYMAGVTRRAQLGALVTAVTYRHPGQLIKTVSALDVLSGGRAILGIGAGWYEREARGLGLPFPPLKERFERLEETLQIAKQVWSDDRRPIQGKHYHLAEPINSPQPLSKPHPPILIGGGGETKTLRLVAQYGDACNFYIRLGIPALQAKLDVLKGHCDQVGRAYEEITRTALGTIHLAPGEMTPSYVIQTCRELAGIGIQHVIFNMPNVYEITPLETIGREIIPEVRGL